jgi:hypothetical protein
MRGKNQKFKKSFFVRQGFFLLANTIGIETLAQCDQIGKSFAT